VARLRRAAGIKRVGHAGTLDPLATGVLIVCVGAATRLSEYVMHASKRYRARVHLGVVTDSYDAEGEIVAERDASAITREQVERALDSFRGEIEQIPPMYSAIKQGGRRLYDLARAGETVERSPRPVRIDALALVEWQPPEFTLEVTCSAGTYIRSLAYDLGAALGVGAYLAGLTRTASGRFTLENAVPLDTLLSSPADWLIAPHAALADFPTITLDAEAEQNVRHGRAISGEFAVGATVMAYDGADRLIAVLTADDGRLLPQKVFI